jgi:hypothetical protein
MVADTAVPALPRERLHRHFATRATSDDPDAWFARAWARAVLVDPSADDAAVLRLLDTAWTEFRGRHPDEPALTFRPPPHPDAEEVVPGPTPYHLYPTLRFGRYGVDLPSHEDRVRDEQERLAKRDQSFYGF